MVEFRRAGEHECGLLDMIDGIDFDRMSHQQTVDYYVDHLDEIEKGLRFLWKDLSIGKGKIDLVVKDKSERICLIEVAHSRSHYQHDHWINKLWRHHRILREISRTLFGNKDFSPRLLILKPLKGVEEIT